MVTKRVSYWRIGPILEEFTCIMNDNEEKTFTLDCTLNRGRDEAAATQLQ
jgi:hypothetical protein